MSRRPPASDDTEQTFLKRWSRRKALQDEKVDPDEEDFEESAESPSHADTDPVASQPGPPEDRPVKTDADMPELDSIDETTDMSGFFSPGVSEALRTRALRHLFRLSKFNVTDGLDDYAEDYRTFTSLGNSVTAHARERLEAGLGERDSEPPPPRKERPMDSEDERVQGTACETRESRESAEQEQEDAAEGGEGRPSTVKT